MTAETNGRVTVPREAVQHAFRNADEKDWEHLFLMLPESGHGKFWKAVFHEVKCALSAAPVTAGEGDGLLSVCRKYDFAPIANYLVAHGRHSDADWLAEIAAETNMADEATTPAGERDRVIEACEKIIRSYLGGSITADAMVSDIRALKAKPTGEEVLVLDTPEGKDFLFSKPLSPAPAPATDAIGDAEFTAAYEAYYGCGSMDHKVKLHAALEAAQAAQAAKVKP